MTDPATGAVIFTAIYDGGDISFTPPADYAGTLAATVTVTDPMGSSDTTGFDVIVTPVNDVPVITSLPQVGAVIEDETSANATTAFGQLTATDADGNALTWTLIGSPTSPYGTLTLQPNGQWTFVLDQNAPATQALGVTGNLGGQALYLAQVSDGNGGTVTAPIAIAIAGNNDAPDLSAVVLADVTMPRTARRRSRRLRSTRLWRPVRWMRTMPTAS